MIASFLLAAALTGAPLRVCADPDYMPYSNRAGQGFENHIAQAIGRSMGRPVVYVWQSIHDEDGFAELVHKYVDKGRCDLVVDVPYSEPDLATTKPYYISSYVFIYKKNAGLDGITSLDSPQLRHVKIGYEADTPVEDGLKVRTLTIGAKPFLTASDALTSPDAIVNAVQSGAINVGLSWDPAVGYYIAKHPNLTAVVIPNTRSQGAPEQYTFPMAMAAKLGNTALTAQVDRAIVQARPEIDRILSAYHIQYFTPNGSQ